MKNLFSMLIFLSVISCSTLEQSFLDQVKGKSIYEGGTKNASFSSNGKSIDLGEEGTATFLEAISETQGVYKSRIDGGDNFLGIHYGGNSSLMYVSAIRSELFTDKITSGDKTSISIR